MPVTKLYDLDVVSVDEFVSVDCIRMNYSMFRRYLELRARCDSPRVAFSMAFRGRTEAEAREEAKGKPHAPDTAKARAIESCDGFAQALKKRIDEIPVTELWNVEIARRALVALLVDHDATTADRAECVAELDLVDPNWRGHLSAGLVHCGASSMVN